MPKRSSIEKDENQIASSIIDQIVGVNTPTTKPTKNPIKKKTLRKNPAAVALGRLGGLKGGKARAAKLTAKKRQQIARKAAKKRWSKNP